MIITINLNNKQKKIELDAGKSLLDAINKAGIEGFDAPCGGKGTCGKCRVQIHSNAPEPDSLELKSLTSEQVESGIRLACRVFPEADTELSIASSGKKALIQSSFLGELSQEVLGDRSVYSRSFIELSEPSIEDQRSDLKRLNESFALQAGEIVSNMPVRLLRELPGILRDNDFSLTVSLFNGAPISVSGGNTAGDYYAVAVDIGTTTVVSYLLSLAGGNRGEIIDHVSGLNSQKGYGGDVVSRIEYCMQAPGNLEELQCRITSQISGMVKELAFKNKIDISRIGLLTIAGNTTMTHLFEGLDPKGIAAAPFIPVDTSLHLAPAADFGLELHPGCGCAVLPGIASYVGADITAGIAATGMYESDELCLLIDIGTNGEIVLGDKSGMTACSTAAGPALEGANISCGMGGIPGAINSLSAEELGDREVFSFSVIDEIDPVGICGSGIVDAVALFVGAGLIDETGRILEREELTANGVHTGWVNCVVKDENGISIRITKDIYITQKDIREVQMAKAAIAAGVKTLLSETGRAAGDIKKLFIAGGFGAAMNKSSAAAVGLFPAELEDVVEIAGNTAGKGAILSALSGKVMRDMEKIADDVVYIELSTSALFQQEYMMSMYF